MKESPSGPEPERRASDDRRAEPTPSRREKQSRLSKLVGATGHEVLIVVGALIAIIAAISLSSPIFANNPKVAETLEEHAPVLAKAVLQPTPTPTDTSRIAQLMATPQFQADKKAFAADLVGTGRVDSARADSIAYYAVREAYANGIPPAVVFGVMLTENAKFVSGAMSDVGAVGLMQVYPKVWLKALKSKFGGDLATDSTNLKYGIYILRQYIKSDSGALTAQNVGKGLLKYNGCVTGSHTPNCKNYPTKVRNFVEKQAESICGDKSFYDCIAKPFLTGLTGRQQPTPSAAQTR